MELFWYDYATRVLACILLCLTMGDIITTLQALKRPGTREANPVMRFVMGLLDGKWIIVRMGFTMVILFMAFRYGGWRAAALLLIDCAVLVYVVWHNNRVART